MKKYILVTEQKTIRIYDSPTDCMFVANLTVKTGTKIELYQSRSGMLIPYPPSFSISGTDNESINSALISELSLRLKLDEVETIKLTHQVPPVGIHNRFKWRE